MLLQGGRLATVVATQDSEYAQLAQLGAGVGAQLITQKYGRDAERESDYYGMQYMSRAGYDPKGAVELQKTFVKLSEGKRQDWLSGLFASHPPSQERVQNNRQTLGLLPPGGEDGKQRFQKQLAHLRKTAPAYEAYDEGRKALVKGNVQQARQLALKARRLEPREAHFEALLGDIEAKRGNHRAALSRYNKALQLNDGFFYYYLKKGLVNERQGDRTQAKLDLQNSIELLPTANAYNSLGDIARLEGRYQQAKTYYARASKDNSKIGKQALASLVELDLPDNPVKYLQLRLGVDKSGRTVAQVTNNTPRPVKGVVIGQQLTDKSGRRQSGEVTMRRSLAPGKTATINLGLDKVDAQVLKTLRAGIVRAALAQ